MMTTSSASSSRSASPVLVEERKEPESELEQTIEKVQNALKAYAPKDGITLGDLKALKGKVTFRDDVLSRFGVNLYYEWAPTYTPPLEKRQKAQKEFVEQLETANPDVLKQTVTDFGYLDASNRKLFLLSDRELLAHSVWNLPERSPFDLYSKLSEIVQSARLREPDYVRELEDEPVIAPSFCTRHPPLSVAMLLSLSEEHLHKMIEHLPQPALDLLSPDQLQSLNFSRLSKKCLERLSRAPAFSSISVEQALIVGRAIGFDRLSSLPDRTLEPLAKRVVPPDNITKLFLSNKRIAMLYPRMLDLFFHQVPLEGLPFIPEEWISNLNYLRMSPEQAEYLLNHHSFSPEEIERRKACVPESIRSEFPNLFNQR